jgi:hypothetical protein
MGKTIYKTVSKPKCGLCGKTKKLTKTECCGQWICNDSDQYVLFSYARNSCWRNHDHFTVCAYHHHEEHTGKWQTCKKCRHSFDTEDYVDMATNEYNFEKLDNPPSFKPTKCAECGRAIVRAKEGYTMVPKKGIVCEDCSPVPDIFLN